MKLFWCIIFFSRGVLLRARHVTSPVVSFPIPKLKGSDQIILKAPHSGLFFSAESYTCRITLLQNSHRKEEQKINCLQPYHMIQGQKETNLTCTFNQLLIISVDVTALQTVPTHQWGPTSMFTYPEAQHKAEWFICQSNLSFVDFFSLGS